MKSMNELIYYYKENQNINAFNEIYNRIHDKILYSTIKHYKKVFFNIPLDYSDIEVMVEEYLLKNIKFFNYLQSKFSLEQHCCTITKWNIVNDAQHFLTSSQKILNSCISLSNIYDGLFLKETSSSLLVEESFIDLENNKKIALIKKEIYKLLDNFKNFDQKNIIMLKIRGDSNRSIIKTFCNYNSKQITNMYYWFICKLRNNCLKICYNQEDWSYNKVNFIYENEKYKKNRILVSIISFSGKCNRNWHFL